MLIFRAVDNIFQADSGLSGGSLFLIYENGHLTYYTKNNKKCWTAEKETQI